MINFLYFTTDMGNEAFQLPFKTWIPFDCTNPLGYLIAFAIQCVGTSILCPTTCIVSPVVRFSTMIVTYASDIKEEILNLKIDPKNVPWEVKQKLSEFVELHANAKQLVREYVGIFKFIILIFFSWSLLTICSSLLMIQIELRQAANSLTLLTQICLAFWSFALAFFFCCFGEFTTNYFNELNDSVYQCEWYNCSDEVQPPVVKGFGNVVCTREASKNVANSGFSYFMVLRELGN